MDAIPCKTKDQQHGGAISAAATYHSVIGIKQNNLKLPLALELKLMWMFLREIQGRFTSVVRGQVVDKANTRGKLPMYIHGTKAQVQKTDGRGRRKYTDL